MHPKQPQSLHSTGLDVGLGSEGVGFSGLVLCKFPGPCSRQRSWDLVTTALSRVHKALRILPLKVLNFSGPLVL